VIATGQICARARTAPACGTPPLGSMRSTSVPASAAAPSVAQAWPASCDSSNAAQPPTARLPASAARGPQRRASREYVSANSAAAPQAATLPTALAAANAAPRSCASHSRAGAVITGKPASMPASRRPNSCATISTAATVIAVSTAL